MNGGRVAPGARYVAALCPPATVSIQQVKIPVGGGGVYTQCEVPESDGNGVHGAPEAAPICAEERREVGGQDIQLGNPSVKSVSATWPTEERGEGCARPTWHKRATRTRRSSVRRTVALSVASGLKIESLSSSPPSAPSASVKWRVT